MKIVLMRHGKPVLTHKGLVTPAEMEAWIEHYNHSNVKASGVPQSSIHLANAVTHFVSSTAPRALSSLQALGYAPSVTDAIFSEAQLPFSTWRFPRLSPALWAAFFRMLWFCGYSQNSESFQAAKTRANVAANKLVALAEQGSVLLMGHGIMNRLIANELATLGWASSTKQNSHYWAGNVYRPNLTHPSSGTR